MEGFLYVETMRQNQGFFSSRRARNKFDARVALFPFRQRGVK